MWVRATPSTSRTGGYNEQPVGAGDGCDAASARIGDDAAGVPIGGDSTGSAGSSATGSASGIGVGHASLVASTAGMNSGNRDEGEGFTEDESSTDEGAAAEAVAQFIGDPGALKVDTSGQESIPDPARVPIIQNGPTNGDKVLVQAFKGAIKDLVFFTYRVQCRLTREAREAMLRKCRRELISATPHELNRLVCDSVSVHTKRVDACREGCVADTTDHKSDKKCWKCGAARYTSAGEPAQQVE